MSGHTPTPWRAAEPDPFGDYTIVQGGGGLAIAVVVKNLRDSDEVEANARLIARAWEIPELEAQRGELLDLARKVAELDELSQAWSNRGGDPKDKIGEWRRRRELEEQIRASAGPLVAKVEGRS